MKASLGLAGAVLVTLALASPAGAAVKASAALLRQGDALQLEVKVTSTKAFTAATRPRAVKVGALSLKKAAAGRKAVTFRSAPQRGAAATKLEALANTRPAIRVSFRKATKTLHASVQPA